LWDWILDRSEISPEKECIALRKEERNRLIENLMRSKFEVGGRTTYKEEFVTAGGVKLDELDSDGAFKGNSHLFAIGEMLDLDGVTGGFNFQAAWSTAYVCAKKIRSMS
jgi:predicted flavoprotein YhiN